MNSCRNYQTKQKTAIFSLLKEHSESHLTAEQMLTILKDENTPVGKATLLSGNSVLKIETSKGDAVKAM